MRAFLTVLAFASFVVVGCSPSPIASCKSTCDRLQACGQTTNVAACKANCDIDYAGSCVNAGIVAAGLDVCTRATCSELERCIQQSPRCESATRRDAGR